MIWGYYFYFQKYLHCEWLSAVLAMAIQVVRTSICAINRLLIKPQIVLMSHDEAIRVIEKVHPNRIQQTAFIHHEPDQSLDLSIILPVYNYVKLIDACIQSILNQKTQYSYELIIVDDGSTDGSTEIVKDYQSDIRVKAIFQNNKGIASARNTGLDNARGKYVMFVDCDDTVKDNLVQMLMCKAYEDHSEIVMCGHDLVKERNGCEYARLPNIYPAYNLCGYRSNAKKLNYAGLPWAKVYDRELFRRVRFFQGSWYEDTIIHALIFPQCTKFSYVPISAYEYRWYENNYSHTQGNSADYKSIDIYWLMSSILKTYDIVLDKREQKDECFYTMLVLHLSYYYYHKIKELEDDIVKAAFSLACDLYFEHSEHRYKLPIILRIAEQSLQRRDFNLWRLAIKYM